MFAFGGLLNSRASRSVICRMAVVMMGKLITTFLNLCITWWKKRVGVWIHVCAHKELPCHGAKALKWWTEALLYLQRAFATRLTSTDHLIPEALSPNILPQHPQACSLSKLVSASPFSLPSSTHPSSSLASLCIQGSPQGSVMTSWAEVSLPMEVLLWVQFGEKQVLGRSKEQASEGPPKVFS